MRETMITGHSGFENTGAATLNSVAAAIRMGLDCVEVDVRLDPEGIPRLSHDDFKNYKEAVLLRDAFELIAPSGIFVNVDLKTPDPLYAVLNLADECEFRPGQLIFSGSVEGSVLDADADIVHHAQVFWNLEEIIKSYFMSSETYMAMRTLPREESREAMDELINSRFEEFVGIVKNHCVAALNLSYLHLKSDTLEKLREHDIPLSVWTVNDEDRMKRIFALKPVNLTTMQPTLALKVRNEM